MYEGNSRLTLSGETHGHYAEARALRLLLLRVGYLMRKRRVSSSRMFRHRWEHNILYTPNHIINAAEDQRRQPLEYLDPG